MSITEQQTVAIPTGTFQADVVHSTVAFEVGYMGIGTFNGTVRQFAASLTEGKLAGTAQIATLETKDDNLLGHLLSPEFFDAERYPQVGFETSSVSSSGEGRVEFEGEITIKGITRPATLTGTVVGPITDPYGNERYGLKLETTIDRTEFGILWNSELPNGTKALADEVTLKADLSLVKVA